jgi:hypothetical protein
MKKLLLAAAILGCSTITARASNWWHVNYTVGECQQGLSPADAHILLRNSGVVDNVQITDTISNGKMLAIRWTDKGGSNLDIKFYSNWGDCAVARDIESVPLKDLR